MPLIEDENRNNVIFFDRIPSLIRISSSGSLCQRGGWEGGLKLRIRKNKGAYYAHLTVHFDSMLVLNSNIRTPPFDICENDKCLTTMSMWLFDVSQGRSYQRQFLISFYEESSARLFYDTCNDNLSSDRKGPPFNISSICELEENSKTYTNTNVSPKNKKEKSENEDDLVRKDNDIDDQKEDDDTDAGAGIDGKENEEEKSEPGDKINNENSRGEKRKRENDVVVEEVAPDTSFLDCNIAESQDLYQPFLLKMDN